VSTSVQALHFSQQQEGMDQVEEKTRTGHAGEKYNVID